MCTCIILGTLLAVATSYFMIDFDFSSYFYYWNNPLIYTTFMGVSIWTLIKYGKNYIEYLQLQSITRTKQLERNNQFDRLRQQYPLTDDRLRIINLPTEVLMEKLRTRNLSAADVLAAFIAKSLDATSKYNCITEFIPNAMDLADEADVMAEIKPLHGLPVCIKDDTNVEGMDSTLGYAKNLFKPAKESAVLVKILKELGAIPFCKTNIPQTLVSFGSDNPIFGKTLNCVNPKLAPGGSSSGTGCLVGALGSPIGTGTDIGGSGRVPAHFNGVCSLKPTSKRLSGKGIIQATPNCIGLVGVPALFAQRSKILAYLFKSLTENNKQNIYDPLTVPISWNQFEFESNRKLRIGYFTSLSFFPLMGDTEETILNAKNAFEALGHTVVPFDLPVDDYNLAKVMGDLANSDTGKHLRKELQGEKIAEAAKMINRLINMPFWLRKLLSFVMQWNFIPMLRSARAAYCLLAGLDLRLTTNLWDCMGEKQKITEDILKLMDDKKIDLLLTPVFPFPACRVDDPKDLVVAVIYCMIWNLCDFPAGVVKFGIESGKRIADFDDQGDMILKLAKKSIKDSVGMPIGVQIVGRPYKEELVLKGMVELERFIKK